MATKIRLTINGKPHTADTDPDRPRLDVLREDFDLTGSKYGCGEGQCGACKVLLDGTPVASCITSIGEVDGASVETIEGLSAGEQLHPVQQAFIDRQAMQCGYCVPGHIMTAVALVRDQPDSSEEEIVTQMSEHLCRCCNYENILSAVSKAISDASSESPSNANQAPSVEEALR